MESVDILAFGSHPDDVEFGCGAILIKMAKQGKSVAMADFTLGDKGTNGDPETRRNESLAAAAVVGAKRYFLDFKDCEIVDNYENRLKVVELIRKVRPKLVLVPMWTGTMNHPDHLICGQIVRYACRFARFAKILPELPIHWIQGVLHYIPPTGMAPDFIFDISDEVEAWKEMMGCHASQMRTFGFIDWRIKEAAHMGVLIDKPYAQGLVKGNPVVVKDIMDIAQGTREL